MSTHTPGPWEVYERRTPSGKRSGGLPEITGKGGLPVIADVRWNGHNEKHGLANANLIAAAPALLGWMKARVCHDQQCGDDMCHEARAILRDVEGQS